MNWRARPGSLRCALLALLSWLGMPLCAQSAAPDTSSDRKLTPDGAALAKDAIGDVLRRLDAAFDRGDVDGYLAQFSVDGSTPDHPGAQAMLRQRLAALFALGVPLHRTSSLVGEPVRIGPRTVVRVRHEIHATFPEPQGQRVIVEDSLLALRSGAGATAVPTFAVEIAGDAEFLVGRPFQCPACNYAIGGVDGWLCVPTRRDRAQALEGASFYRIGTDLACDVSVQIDDELTAPTIVAERLGQALRQLDPASKPRLATAWLPPAHAATPPRELAGARIEVDLPADAASSDGSRAVFHVSAFGALQHLLLVRGSNRALRDHEAALQALLHSFHLLDGNCDRALAAARPVEHHTGGALSNGVYQNEKFQLELTGPKGWKAQQRCGGAEFKVVWTSPGGSRLWLTGYAVPPGLERWCSRTADLWLGDLCSNMGMQQGAAAGDWVRIEPCDVLSRSMTWVGKPGSAPSTLAQRQLRCLLRDDLLVVADSTLADDADKAPMRAAIDSLIRR